MTVGACCKYRNCDDTGTARGCALGDVVLNTRIRSISSHAIGIPLK